jgi:3-oxoacyl-[acyl-carrier-protein] synthase II
VRRAVITGVGVVSAFGMGTEAFFGALERGESAIGTIRNFDATGFPTTVAGEVPVFDVSASWLCDTCELDQEQREIVTQAFERGAFRDRKVAFGVVAAMEAWRSAKCSPSDTEAWSALALGLEQAFLEDFGAVFSNGSIAWAAKRATPGEVRYRSRVDLCAELVHKLLRLRGPCIVNASACAAGGLSIGHAASLIERGAASIVLCGAADSMVNPLGLGGMSRLGAPSPRSTFDACRPFDRRRDGLVIGEGAAMFVVESEAHAHARGATPIAQILGWGSTQDAYRVTAPRPDGARAALAMQKALRRAALPGTAVHYINAHGTGTPLNDPAEAQAIRDTFGAHTDEVHVSSIKGAVGHLMAASGALEAAACLLPLQRSIVPATAHHREPDPACNITVVGERPLEARVDVALSNSFGFGGQNATLVLGKVGA